MDTTQTIKTILNKPDHIVSLATSSLLVSVEVSVWTATQQDRAISDEVTASKSADRNAGRFVKHILADDPNHKAVLNYRQTVYNWLQRCTYDWSGAQRILPTVKLPDFMKEYQHHEKAFYELVEKFLAKYPDIVSTMAFKQGDMFRRSDYPSVEQLRHKFSMNLYTAEVPLGDYRCQVAEDLADDLFNNYSRQAERLIDQILSKQAEQFITVMESLSHCCALETVIDKHGLPVIKKRKIYDSTLNRALELCETFKQFNLTANPQLEQARVALAQTLDGISLEQLRESETLREQVKHGVDGILKTFKPVTSEACAKRGEEVQAEEEEEPENLSDVPCPDEIIPDLIPEDDDPDDTEMLSKFGA